MKSVAPATEKKAARKIRATDPVDLHLGRQIRRRRRLLGLTQQEVADACGVGFQQVQKWECADNRIYAAHLWSLADVLNVPINYFYEGLPRKQQVRLVAVA